MPRRKAPSGALAFSVAMAVVKPLRRGVRPTVRTIVAGGTTAGHVLADATRKGRDALSELYTEAASERAREKSAKAGEQNQVA
ncbi:MAG: hypothetical protein GEU75_10690 [Dehalococcoidia bacterium]|nr:hypothetical protein [Dehalococcoidia bacterium]